MTLLYKTKTLLLFLITIFELINFITCQSPVYNYHYCLGPDNDIATASYKSNLTALLDSISSKASDHSFYNDSLNGVYSLFLCTGNVSSNVCQVCVNNATVALIRRCPYDKRAIIWYDQCMLEYSNINFFGLLRLRPNLLMWNARNITSPVEGNNGTRGFIYALVDRALYAKKMFATNELVVEKGTGRRFGLVQCSRDLNISSCFSCLTKLLKQTENCCVGRTRWRIFTPSCYIRYEMMSRFISDSFPSGPPPKNKENIDRKSQEVQLLELNERVGNDYSNEIFQDESRGRSQEFPLIQLHVLQTATKQFCDENKLGQGGFGPVYKGKLPDGKEIAVKRLSESSGQGQKEFENEVQLIAKLQHKNLVRLLGYCVEQNEKMLVYEYMPNKSLDAFLFDSSKSVQLDWQKRFSIINGIARGMMYLHEDSRLKIIHRDLKVNNILLNYEMNPTISDFGLARIFPENQSRANTGRLEGTRGYIAPEYAKEGLLSVKSDVYSFGVILLEIISGKKNNHFHRSECGENLLTFAWKLWSKGQGMELVDPLLVQSCVTSEVVNCIRIGLLCVQKEPADRPIMSSVVAMLTSETIELPQPTEPSFFVGHVEEPAQPTSNDRACSVNEVTISDISPR